MLVLLFKWFAILILLFAFIKNSIEIKCNDDDVECHERAKYTKGKLILGLF